MIARIPGETRAPSSSGLRLTFAGRLLAAPTLALALAGWLQGGFPALIASFLLSAFVLSALAATLHLRGLRIASPPPAQGEVGSVVSFSFEVENSNRSLSVAALHLDAEREREGDHPASGEHAWLAPGTRASIQAGVRLSARGRLESLGVHASSSYPLGLVRRVHHYDLPVDLMGLPRTGRLATFELHAHSAARSSSEGRPRPGSDEIAGLRDWRPGDSLRRVHWRRSATREDLVLRELHRAAAPPLEVLLDTNSEPGRSFERAIQIAATLLERAVRTERQCILRVGLDRPGISLTGPGALLQGQTALALTQAEPRDEGTELAAIIRQLESEGRRVALIVASGRSQFDREAAHDLNRLGVRVFDADSKRLARGLHAELENA